MGLQSVEERKRPPQAAYLQNLYPVAKTISGTAGACSAIITGVPSGTLRTMSGSEWVSNATAGVSFGTAGVSVGRVYYVGASEYDPAFVTQILAADAEPAVEGFDNVVDLLDWLNRD
jgi:hypothetical protein